jgi:TonB family protein
MTSQRRTWCAHIIVAAVMSIVVSMIVPASPANAQGAATEKIALPAFRGTLRDDYYPADARLHYRQGRALVEFSVDARGVPTDVVVVSAEPAREFDDAARLLARNLRYQVPPDWQPGAAAHRFRIGVRFQVLECINFSHCEPQARNPPADYDAADRTYVVSAQRRVVTLLSQPPVAPPTAPASAPTPASAAAPASVAPAAPPASARPQATPAARAEEPVYPPG